MPLDGAAIWRRYEGLKRDRATFDARWEKMAPLIAPSRQGITGMRAAGADQTSTVYDSTTMMAAELMAHFIAGHVLNPAQRWFDLALAARGRRLAGGTVEPFSDAVREWQEAQRDRLLTLFARSAFYAEATEHLVDYGGFGTGCLLLEEAPQPVNRTIRGFRGYYACAVKTGRFCIAEGADGLVDTLFREYELSARSAADRWGVAALPEAMAKSVQEGQPDKSFTILHAILPRATKEQAAIGATGMPWASGWIEQASKQVLHESGYQAFPACVPRYQRTPGEIFGRGRGDLAFPDAWTLNTAKEMGLQDWALKIRPPVLMRHDSVIGTLSLKPGTPTMINTRGLSIRDAIGPYETGSHPEVSQIKEEELRRSIREIFFVDAIREILAVHKSEMTAFEFRKRLELLFRLMGPVYGRLEWEALHRVIDIGWALAWEGGELDAPPPEVYDTDGTLDVTFLNPLAAAQKSGDTEALALAVADLMPVGQIYPQVWDWMDPDKIGPGVFALRGVPAAWTRDPEEVGALRQARQAQDQNQLALEEAGQVAEAAGKAAPMLKLLQGGAAPQ